MLALWCDIYLIWGYMVLYRCIIPWIRVNNMTSCHDLSIYREVLYMEIHAQCYGIGIISWGILRCIYTLMWVMMLYKGAYSVCGVADVRIRWGVVWNIVRSCLDFIAPILHASGWIRVKWVRKQTALHLHNISWSTGIRDYIGAWFSLLVEWRTDLDLFI
jgi:hypothetical protein